MTNSTNNRTCAFTRGNTTKFFATALVATTAIAGTANATETDAQAVFQGLILDTCTVNVLNPGVLGASADQTRLASDEIGGLPANALVVTNSDRSSIQVLPPLAFDTAPIGSNVNTEFSTSYTLVGTTNATAEDGQTLTDLELGSSDMVINAEAAKTEGNFNGGAYTFVTTVRCITP